MDEPVRPNEEKALSLNSPYIISRVLSLARGPIHLQRGIGDFKSIQKDSERIMKNNSSRPVRRSGGKRSETALDVQAGNESRRKSELRAAAARLFLKVGYDRSTVRDIAKMVGMQSGSIFYHYQTKEDILVDVMSEGLRQFKELATLPLRGATTPLEKLRALFVGHLKALHSPNRAEIAVVISEWRQLSSESRRQVVKLRDEVDAIWDQVLREAAAEGIVKGDLRILRLSMLGSINWSLQWWNKKSHLNIDDLADRLFQSFVPKD